MISIREEIAISMPPDVLWPILSDPQMVASCIPGAALTKSAEDGTYEGTMRVKFGPTVALFRGEAKLAAPHLAKASTRDCPRTLFIGITSDLWTTLFVEGYEIRYVAPGLIESWF
jgi:Carbon monoxide dehydrogenase subunit G (CoxG)